jgi:5-methylthioribose kinase
MRFMRTLFEDSLAFGGLKMIRRILGLAHTEDLESIADPDRRAICERKALQIGRALVLRAAAFRDIADVIAAAKILAA